MLPALSSEQSIETGLFNEKGEDWFRIVRSRSSPFFGPCSQDEVGRSCVRATTPNTLLKTGYLNGVRAFFAVLDVEFYPVAFLNFVD